MKNGAVFPAIIVFKDGEGYLLADGSHRLCRSQAKRCSEILADVRDGTRSDAIKFALAANTTNGLRRTNADKRNCVEIALKELTLSSNRAIAELCAVSDMLVADVRRDQGEGEVQDSGNSTHTGKDGKKYPAKKLAPRAKKAHRNGAAAQVRQVRAGFKK